MPEQLKKFRREYNYLFYTLEKFVQNTSCGFDAVHVEDTLCKFLEIFASAKRPVKDNLKGKIKEIADGWVDKYKILDIIEFVGTAFHTQMEKCFMDENFVKDVVKQVFEFIKKSINIIINVLKKFVEYTS
jgi:phage-related protein